MDFANVRILKGLMPDKRQNAAQFVQLSASADLKRGLIEMSWQHFLAGDCQGVVATGVVECGYPQQWMNEWVGLTHLLTSRIDTLHEMANKGLASRLSRDLIYTLFHNLVEYSEAYHGMQSVVLNGMEATAEIILSPPSDGKWSVSPNHIDPIAHIGGFALNCGNAVDNRKNIFVMDSWQSMRFARPLAPGAIYQTYVKMQPVPGSSRLYMGDVYVLQASEVVGLVKGMTLRSYPRSLLNHFFPKEEHNSLISMDEPSTATVDARCEAPTFTPSTDLLSTNHLSSHEANTPSRSTSGKTNSYIGDPRGATENDSIERVMALIALETGMDEADMTDETTLSSMGVDSLLSLVLVQRFTNELNIVLQNHVLLECLTIWDLKMRLASPS